MSEVKISATASIDRQTWEKVEAVLEKHCFTVSDAFRLMLMHTAAQKELPFDCFIPNMETIAAMRELENGSLPTFNSVAELMADLNSDEED